MKTIISNLLPASHLGLWLEKECKRGPNPADADSLSYKMLDGRLIKLLTPMESR